MEWLTSVLALDSQQTEIKNGAEKINYFLSSGSAEEIHLSRTDDVLSAMPDDSIPHITKLRSSIAQNKLLEATGRWLGCVDNSKFHFISFLFP